MADAGALEKLPPEIRNKIYALLLTERKIVDLKTYRGKQTYIINDQNISRTATREVAPDPHSRNPKHRLQKWDASHRKWVEVYGKTALLRANKKIEAEASPILYGSNNFKFKDAQVFDWFMTQIGENKQHVRSIAFRYGLGPGEFGRGCAFVRAMLALSAAKGLREVVLRPPSGLDYQYAGSTFEERTDAVLDEIVMACTPLLESLRDSYDADKLTKSVLDLLRITTGGCPSYQHLGEEEAKRKCAIWRQSEREKIQQLNDLLRQKVATQLKVVQR